jgi:hypothetical protein
MRIGILSVYMANLPMTVVSAQRAVLDRLVAEDMAIVQLQTGYIHSVTLDALMALTSYDILVFLDIDCIPLHRQALKELCAAAAAGELAGAVQRASHLENGGHLYVGPFCMALARETWLRLGKPSFRETPRGDVGEELTYRCEEQGVPVRFLWPTAVDNPVWPLRDGIMFGHGTAYADSFWHAFEIRQPQHRARFLERCRAILDMENG